MLWFSRILLSLILLATSAISIFILRTSYTSLIGIVLLTIEFAFEENTNSKMNHTTELLNEYIKFSNKSKNCKKIGFYSSIWGKIVIGIFTSTVFMVLIPFPKGSLPFKSPDNAYKYNKEKFAYLYNYVALIMSVVYFYISTKFFMNVISCSISGTYAKLTLNKYNNNNQTIDQDTLIINYLKKSFQVCYGTLVAQPLNHIYILITTFLKTLLSLLFRLPIYFFIIAINFFPVFLTIVLLMKVKIITIIIILSICFVVSFIFSGIIYNSDYKLNIKHVNIYNINIFIYY